MKSSFRRRAFAVLSASATLGMALCVSAVACADEATAASAERWREEPVPPPFHVEASELEGPVYADSRGRTLYIWPQHKLRNGYSGEAAGTPACYDEVLTVTAGLMSPYPAGIMLPDLNSRLSCTDVWPPVYADADAEPLGKWTLIERRDGTRQWAYDEQPLYTSVRDSEPGDTFGGTGRKRDGDAPAVRAPLGPPSLLPPGFAVKTTAVGRMLTTSENYAVYASEQDSLERVSCTDTCLERWQVVAAPALARSRGEWAVLERAPGVRQWAFRGQPLYTHRLDSEPWSQEGSDAPGWANVFTQRPTAHPASFTEQATLAGTVLADRHGKTIYLYQCGEDSADQLACDHPADTQVYRFAMCGAGDPQKCLQYWPYVVADAQAGPRADEDSRVWRVVRVNPLTGRFAAADDDPALRVWAYRDRPVYTFAGDASPGDVNGAGTGEWRGKRNGLLAFWLRDDFMKGIQ